MYKNVLSDENKGISIEILIIKRLSDYAYDVNKKTRHFRNG